MMHLMQQFEYLKIQLKAIKLATKNFANENCIGRGGFGKVYKGELVHYKGKEIVAIKRLDPVFGQGNPEFWREIIMLSLYKHDNIVSLLGFCDESDEKILVYEYASRRSLDSYLNKDDLIWIQRLNICIGAARGLAYLHNPFGTQQRVLHRDIKSSNILLDENWNAKISDLGLSKFGPANQDYTFLVTNGVGTIGYCDPLYMETGLLTKESDVYSFGVVLFEVLCGRLCIGNKNGIHRPLTGLVRQYYPQNKINEIIFGKIKDEMNPKSLEVFTTIAYRCLSRDLEERPLMTDIVSILESALKYQLELNSFDLKNNPIQSSSYEQGETTHEKSSDMLVLMLCSKGVWEGFYPLRNKWIRLPTIPCEESFNYSQQESVAVGSELLVFGREVLRFVIWKYSFIRRHWLKCDGMNHPRSLFGSGTLGSIAIVAGGCDKNGNILKSAELYDSSTGRWEILPDMHSPRRLCSSFFMDKKFYVIGGITSSTDHSLTCGEEFDLNTKHWRKIDGMYPIIVKKVAQAPPLVAVVSNELYALDYLSSMVKKYDKNKNTWDVLGRLPIKASSMEGWSLVFKACGDRLLVVYVQKSLENASIVLNSWSPKSRIEDGILDWNVLGVKEQESQFVYDCAVMGC